jgi:hypothetical protein
VGYEYAVPYHLTCHHRYEQLSRLNDVEEELHRAGDARDFLKEELDAVSYWTRITLTTTVNAF